MPLYEYRCPACRHAWDALLSRWDSPAPACPACGAERSERRLSAFAVVSGAPAGGGAAEGACGTGSCACRRERDLS
jgi:putative FmdB family regulatory protein